MPSGTPLTGWIDGPQATNLYTCNGQYGTVWYSMLGQYRGRGGDTGMRVFRDGAAVPVISTNVYGIGIAIAARAYFQATGWTPWMQGMQYPAGDILLSAEIYTGDRSRTEGGQVSYQLVKTTDGLVNAGQVSNLYTKLLEAPLGPNTQNLPGAWSAQMYSLAPIQIVPLTCRTPDVNVAMGNISIRDFHGPGTTAGRKSFSIELTNCSDGIQSIEYSLDPITQIIDPVQGVIGLEADGAATGVGLQLLDDTGHPVPLQQAIPYSGYVPGSVSASIPLQAAYYQTADTVTPGHANSAVRFTITYQ